MKGLLTFTQLVIILAVVTQNQHKKVPRQRGVAT